tara:strand:- start:193 stop:423 length:231 start_codon:yes stop_codon:yes gene_type:complete
MMIFIGIVLFAVGFMLGVQFKSILFTRLDWNLLKWDNDIFAYRPAQRGALIRQDDKVLMAIRIPTSNMPKEGFKYE